MHTEYALIVAATVTASITTAAIVSDTDTGVASTDYAITATATATAVVAIQGVKPARSYCVIQQGNFQRKTEVESKKADPAWLLAVHMLVSTVVAHNTQFDTCLLLVVLVLSLYITQQHRLRAALVPYIAYTDCRCIVSHSSNVHMSSGAHSCHSNCCIAAVLIV
jgi:hypothetical protein